MAYKDRYGLSRRDPGAMDPFTEFFASPFGMMRRMADEMNQTFNQGLGAARNILPFGAFPSVDVRDAGDAYVVEADLPGVRASDIDVTVQAETLTLKGQTSQTREEGGQEQGYYVSERRYGTFHREIPLPGPVDDGAATARFENGVLQVRLPKTGQEQGRRIRVDGSQNEPAPSEPAGAQIDVPITSDDSPAGA